jgi:mono/diheme cytochrome c family protein
MARNGKRGPRRGTGAAGAGRRRLGLGFVRRRCTRAAAAVAVVAVLLLAAAGCGGPEVDRAALAAATVPAEHGRGEAVFRDSCVVCHGERALGTEQGPPLVHFYYRTRHHGDDAFRLAVRVGVRAHHWRFGDMPAVPGLDEADVEAVIGYVRWLQRTAGIE